MRRRAGAAVETAVVLPFLMLLALGATDLGRFSHIHISLATSARNGAQYAAVSSSNSRDTSGIRRAALAELQGISGVREADVRVQVQRISSSQGGRQDDDDDDDDDGRSGGQAGASNSAVRVTVAYRFVPLVRYPGLPAGLNLVRSVQMRVMPDSARTPGRQGDDD